MRTKSTPTLRCESASVLTTEQEPRLEGLSELYLSHRCSSTSLSERAWMDKDTPHPHRSIPRTRTSPRLGWPLLRDSQSIAYRRSCPTTSLLGFFNRRKEEERKNVQKSNYPAIPLTSFAPMHLIPSQTWETSFDALGQGHSQRKLLISTGVVPRWCWIGKEPQEWASSTWPCGRTAFNWRLVSSHCGLTSSFSKHAR